MTRLRASFRLDGLAKLLSLEVRDGRLDDAIEAAVHDCGQIVNREPDAMISHAVLREVVGADFFGAVAAADHSFSRCRQLGFALLPLDLVQTRFEDFER